MSDIKDKYNQLVEELNNARREYNENMKQYSNSLLDNPFLGKIVNNTTYITQQGVAKSIKPNTKLYCNADTVVPLQNQTSFLSFLPKGTPLLSTQTCGNEGNDVILAPSLPSNITSNPIGCYLNTNIPQNFTPIGPVSSTLQLIVNGNFSNPQIKSNSYQNLQNILGWYGNFNLLNNASSWWYPTPYPNNLQAISLQGTQSISQQITIPSNLMLEFWACGRPNYGPNPIQILYDNKLIQTITPDDEEWVFYSIPIKINKNKSSSLLVFQGTSSTDLSSAFTNIQLSYGKSKSLMTSTDCANAAALNGSTAYVYNGYCLISSGGFVPPSTIPQTPSIPSNPIVLWSSNTQSEGVAASITNQGQLVVWDNLGKQVYATPYNTNNTTNFIGCFADKNQRAMTAASNGKRNFTHASCQEEALKTNSQYYGTQWYDGNSLSECYLSNDLNNIKKYGNASNCVVDNLNNKVGGGWSNAVFNTQPSSEYFLMIEDNGNMSIYLGASPKDKGMQLPIWTSNTSVGLNALKIQSKSSSKNWISSTDLQKLALGQFIGSPNGYVYLQMDKTGNLILYSNVSQLGCQGDALTSSMYSVTGGIPWTMVGKAGSVDANGSLFKSSSFTNEFYNANGMIWESNDGTIMNNATTDEQCKNECINNSQCSEYSFSKSNGCQINTSSNPIHKFNFVGNENGNMYKRKQFTTSSSPIELNDVNQWNNYATSNKPFNTLINIDPQGLEKINNLESRVFELANIIKNNSKPDNTQYIWDKHYSKFQQQTKELQQNEINTNNYILLPDDNDNPSNNFITFGSIAVITFLAGISSLAYL